MWKFQEFSVIKILRGINLGECRNPKTTIFAIFKISEFCSFGEFQLSKSAKMHKNKNSEPLNV